MNNSCKEMQTCFHHCGTCAVPHWGSASWLEGRCENSEQKLQDYFFHYYVSWYLSTPIWWHLAKVQEEDHSAGLQKESTGRPLWKSTQSFSDLNLPESQNWQKQDMCIQGNRQNKKAYGQKRYGCHFKSTYIMVELMWTVFISCDSLAGTSLFGLHKCQELACWVSSSDGTPCSSHNKEQCGFQHKLVPSQKVQW